MFVMTTKVDIKKILIILAAVAAAILAVVLLFGGSGETAQTDAPAVSGNDARVKFLTDMGWDVTASPTETSQVRIPEEQSPVFERYNALQKSQGYDLTQFAGKKVMRYVYKINNFPGATEPVFATLLVYKNRIIGGDITDTGAKGVVQGFQRIAKEGAETTPTEPTVTQPQPAA
ncbi:MAG: DUF4830 domain-containing protein [Oscillospiraceae bacterium]|nr:DUF4830 domain-containing protein [Oscillospiraceae bacterium]